jgi:hypothetical protein
MERLGLNQFLSGKPANNQAPKGSVQKLSSENAK